MKRIIKAKRSQLIVPVMVFLGLIMCGLLLVKTINNIFNSFPSLAQYFGLSFNFLSVWATGIVFFFAFLLSIISYLNKGVGERKSENPEGLAHKVDSRNQLEVNKVNDVHPSDFSLSITDEERNEFIEQAKKRIVGNTIKLAEDSLKKDIASLNKTSSIQEIHKSMVYRLEDEIENLNRRGGVNLGIGSTIAIAGMLILAYFVYNSQFSVKNVDSFFNFVPKFSFVFVVELFAYFFLRLYKNGFEEIKYYQNEITNIEMKVMSIRYMQGTQNDDVMKELSLHLMRTERNFILEKGQSTYSLEKDKIKELSDSKLIGFFCEILNKTKKNN